MALSDSREAYLKTFVFHDRYALCNEDILNKARELSAYIYLTYFDAHVSLFLLKETKNLFPEDLSLFDHESPVTSVWRWSLTEAIIKVCQLLDGDLRNETASLPFITHKLKKWRTELNIENEEMSGLECEIIREFDEIIALRDKVLIHLEPKKQITVLERATQTDYINSLEKVLDQSVLPWLSNLFVLLFKRPTQINIDYKKANNILDLLNSTF